MHCALRGGRGDDDTTRCRLRYIDWQCLVYSLYLLTYHLVRSQYTNTLSELVKVTADNVEKYIAEAAIVTGISQRINAQVKIHASIE